MEEWRQEFFLGGGNYGYRRSSGRSGSGNNNLSWRKSDTKSGDGGHGAADKGDEVTSPPKKARLRRELAI